MWKHCALLALLTVDCVSARSDDAKSSAQAASQPLASTERFALVPTEARRAAELDAAFPDDAIVRFGDGAERAIGVYAYARRRSAGNSRSRC